MKLNRIIAVLLSLCMIFTSGCWDMIEIEKRALVGAMIIDLIDKDEEKAEINKTSPFCEEKPNVIRVTFGINNPSKLLEGGEGAIIPVTVEAANIPDAMEELGSRIPRIPFYGQIRLLMLTEKLMKNEKVFKQIVDEFERKAVINQQLKIIVFQRRAEDVIKVEPKLENIQSLYITGIMENSKVLSNTTSITLSELVSELRNNDGTSTIPVLDIQFGEQNSYVINRLALIKDYKLLDVLDTKYIKTFKIINEKLENGRKLVPYNGITIPYYIFSSNRRVWLVDDSDGLRFRVKVEMEGDIEQFEFDKMLFDTKAIDDVEKTINNYLLRELTATTEYFQKDIGHDYLGFNEYTSKYHNKIFKKYEKNWDEIFRKAKIEYEVNASVRRIGTSKK